MIERIIDVQLAKANRLTFKIRFDSPVKQESHYVCQITFEGWLDSPSQAVKGTDSYQCVIESMVLVYSILRNFEKRGVTFFHPNSDTHYDLSTFLTPVDKSNTSSSWFIP
jgi:hypothetical protein